MSWNSFMMNYNAGKSDRKRDAGLQTPADVERIDDISYGPYGKWNLMDLYLPKQYEGMLPVIVSVHGGGYTYGDKEVYQFYCMSLAQHGFAVVNFTYRLAPQHKFPAALADTVRVMKWIHQNADAFDLDTDNIFMVGDSAGASYAAAYCCLGTNPEYARRFRTLCFGADSSEKAVVNPKYVPKAVALNCGLYRVAADADKKERKGMWIDLFGRKEYSKMIALLEVENYVTEEFPPTFLMTSTGDFLLDQAPYMKAKLEEYDIPFEYHVYGDSEHQPPHVFHCDMRSEYGTLCNEDECEFFRRFCGR